MVRPITLHARIMMIRDDRVILVKHGYQDEWYLPGSGIKRDETLEQAIRREVAEECGATLNQVLFLGIYTNFTDYKNDHTALFLSKDFILKEKNDHEIEAYISGNLNPTGMWSNYKG